MTTPAEIETAALALPPADRVRLGRALCESGWAEIPEPPLSPEELNAMLAERLRRHDENPAGAVDAFGFLDRLRAEDEADEQLLADADRHEAERPGGVRRAA